MDICNSLVSCGVRQVYELSVARFKDIVAQNTVSYGEYKYFDKDYCYIFSDNKGHRQGQRIADLIEEHDLGDLIELGWGRNPNSGNQINTWVWRYNGKIPKEWVKEKSSICSCGDPKCKVLV